MYPSKNKIFEKASKIPPSGIIVSQTPIRHNRNSIAVQYNLNSVANSA